MSSFFSRLHQKTTLVSRSKNAIRRVVPISVNCASRGTSICPPTTAKNTEQAARDYLTTNLVHQAMMGRLTSLQGKSSTSTAIQEAPTPDKSAGDSLLGRTP